MSGFRFRQKNAAPDMDLIPPERRPKAKAKRGFVAEADVSDANFVVIKPQKQGANLGVNARKRLVFMGQQLQNPVLALRLRLEAAFAPQGTQALNLAHWRQKGLALCHPQSLQLFGKRTFSRLEAQLHRLSERGFTTLVAGVAIMCFLLSGGYNLFSQRALEAPMPNPLDITHVTLTPQMGEGLQVLLINAIVENHDHVAHDFPQVEADFLRDGVVLSSTVIDAPMQSLGPEQSLGIATKLRHPGGKTPQLRLHFVDNAQTKP